MNSRDKSFITLHRLHNQQLAQQSFGTAKDLAAWMGITQAQDYQGAKLSLALRIPAATDATIEQAIAEKHIVRSWSFRGTLHFMSPADIRWMLLIAAQRVRPLLGAHFRRFEIDKVTLSKTRKIITNLLRDGRHMTRKEIMAAIEQKNISTAGLRSNLFMLSAAIEGLICCGIRRGKQFTYTLIDEWLPGAPKMQQDEALGTLALRYFNSHGPATIQDLAWWAGITLTDARRGLELIKSQLQQKTIDGQLYYMPDAAAPEQKSSKAFLLPGFDEYMLGYKDRSIVMAPQHAKIVVGAGNGLFSPTIIVGGQVAGTWKRTPGKHPAPPDTLLFDTVSATAMKQITVAARSYGKYTGFM